MRARGWIHLIEVRSRLTVRAFLADAGCAVPRDRRRVCPIHNGDNPTAFSINRDDRSWTCRSHCGSGDALLLARKLHNLDLVRALEHCAALVAVTRQTRTVALRKLVNDLGLSRRNAEPPDLATYFATRADNGGECERGEVSPGAAPALLDREGTTEEEVAA